MGKRRKRKGKIEVIRENEKERFLCQGKNRRGGGRKCSKCVKREGGRTRLRQMQQKKERKNMCYVGNGGNEKENKEEESLVKGGKIGRGRKFW